MKFEEIYRKEQEDIKKKLLNLVEAAISEKVTRMKTKTKTKKQKSKKKKKTHRNTNPKSQTNNR
jgi:hypothetical protein